MLGLIAVSLFGLALYQTVQRYSAALFWRATEATVLERSLVPRRDDDGILRFRMRGSFRYQTPAGEKTASADSDFESREFAWVLSRIDDFPSGARVKVYYDPSSPDKIRFGSDVSVRYLGCTLYYYAGAFLCAVMALWIWSLKPSPVCAACKRKLKSHYRYCPYCGVAVAPLPDSISRALH